MSEIIDYIKPYIPESLKEIDAHQALRLTVIVGGYVLVRNVVQKYLANKQLLAQLKHDEENKEAKKQTDLVDDPNAQATGALADDGSWGWGKKTRRNVKRQEKILQEQLDRLEDAYDEDKDIEDLLED